MTLDNFTAFYPSRPFWAGSKVNFDDLSHQGFHDQMAEEVFSQSNKEFTLKVCRDSRIMLRIEALKKDEKPDNPLEDIVKRWGEYLDYLNAFYLLLDSSMIEIAKTSYFNIHEITNRDAFRVRYEQGKSMSEGVPTESIAYLDQMERYTFYHPHGIPIQNDPRIAMRQVVNLDVIDHATRLFTQVINTPGLEKTLASFAKSLSEYKVGNYETSIVLSWFITEAAINHLWLKHINSLN
jgi:hypothetical protein